LKTWNPRDPLRKQRPLRLCGSQSYFRRPSARASSSERADRRGHPRFSSCLWIPAHPPSFFPGNRTLTGYFHFRWQRSIRYPSEFAYFLLYHGAGKALRTGRSMLNAASTHRQSRRPIVWGKRKSRTGSV